MSNILFFFSTTKIGGAETNIIKLSDEFEKNGHKVFWAFLDNGGPMLEIASYRYKFFCFKFSPIFLLHSLFGYSRFIRTNKIECVLNFGLRVEVVSRIFSKFVGAKRIISNIRSTDDWRKWYHSFLDRITSGKVDIWISNSLAGKLVFSRREKIPLDKIDVIYNFIDLRKQKFTYVNRQSKNVRIGILANVLEKKGYLDLIKISKQLTHLGIQHIIKYAGRDEMNGGFEKKVLSNGLSNTFHRLGYINEKDLFFEDIDIFILPSYMEGFPTSILEALSFGKPVIATNIGGIPEILSNEENGFICNPGDINAFVNAIQQLMIENTYKSIVDNGFLSLKKFEKSVILKQWEAHIQS